VNASFLDEKFAIGQMFRKMERLPVRMLGCGADIDSEGRRSLWAPLHALDGRFETDITRYSLTGTCLCSEKAWLSKEIKHCRQADMYKVEGKAHVYADDPVHRGMVSA